MTQTRGRPGVRYVDIAGIVRKTHDGSSVDTEKPSDAFEPLCDLRIDSLDRDLDKRSREVRQKRLKGQPFAGLVGRTLSLQSICKALRHQFRQRDLVGRPGSFSAHGRDAKEPKNHTADRDRSDHESRDPAGVQCLFQPARCLGKIRDASDVQDAALGKPFHGPGKPLDLHTSRSVLIRLNSFRTPLVGLTHPRTIVVEHHDIAAVGTAEPAQSFERLADSLFDHVGRNAHEIMGDLRHGRLEFRAVAQGVLREPSFRNVDVQPQDAADLITVTNWRDDIVVVALLTVRCEHHISFDHLTGKGPAVVLLRDRQHPRVGADVRQAFSDGIAPSLSAHGVGHGVATVLADEKEVKWQTLDRRTQPTFTLPKTPFRLHLLGDIGYDPQNGAVALIVDQLGREDGINPSARFGDQLVFHRRNISTIHVSAQIVLSGVSEFRRDQLQEMEIGRVKLLLRIPHDLLAPLIGIHDPALPVDEDHVR